MAEFIDMRDAHLKPRDKTGSGDGFNAMGKPIPIHRRTAALNTCREMGLSTEEAWDCVGRMANQLERDQPYEAMGAGMKYIDLTGTYRLMAVLLTAPEPKK